MKATFEVTIKVDGKNVEMLYGMKDGAEGVTMAEIEKVSRAVTRLKGWLMKSLLNGAEKHARIAKNVQFWS